MPVDDRSADAVRIHLHTPGVFGTSPRETCLPKESIRLELGLTLYTFQRFAVTSKSIFVVSKTRAIGCFRLLTIALHE